MTMRCFSFRAVAVQILSLFVCVSTASYVTTTTTHLTTVTLRTSTVTATVSDYTDAHTVVTITTSTQSTPTQTASISRYQTPTQTASMSGNQSWSGSDFESAVLNSTNYFRAQHEAQPLAWEGKLAAYANSYAEHCIWEHSGGLYGENLAEGFATPALAIDDWAGEEKKYNYAKAKFSESTGHYTQLVWQNTTKVGCGAVYCKNDAANGARDGWFLVCEYYPPGNVEGQFKWNVRKPGESANGQLGFGAASRSFNWSSWMFVGLVAASSLATMCL